MHFTDDLDEDLVDKGRDDRSRDPKHIKEPDWCAYSKAAESR